MRLAVSIKKSIGNAVSRNYEKRLCREFFRKKVIEEKGYDVLIIIKNRSENYHTSFNALSELFQNIYSL
jgi:ribonuclease P protein component